MLGLFRFDEARGTSILNVLREQSGGDLPAAPPATGDAVVDSLRAIAIEVYGQLLLPDDAGRYPPQMSQRSPAWQDAVEAIKHDPDLPFSSASDIGDSDSLVTSTGKGLPLNLAHLGPSIVSLAWELARLRNAPASAESLLADIPAAVASARAALAGRQVTATGLASLTGVLLPEGTELTFAWGGLRPAHEGDHPRGIQRALGDRRTRKDPQDGAEIVISDMGDVMLTVSVPFKARVGKGYDAAKVFQNLPARRELDQRIMQVRLALLLALPGTQPPVLLTAWRRFVEPPGVWAGWSWTHPQSFASRTPTQLTPEQAADWKAWIERLDAIPLRRLGVASQRLLRAPQSATTHRIP